MGRKNDGLTPRQRQSQQIMRDKSAKKKRKALVRKCSLIGGGVFTVLLVAGGVWSWKSGAAVRVAQAIEDARRDGAGGGVYCGP